MVQGKFTVLYNEAVVPGFLKMVIAAPSVAAVSVPGQFVYVLCGTDHGPFLRRPFSLHRVNKHSIEILYEVLGQGTRRLSEMRKGDVLDMIGPLGNGFSIEECSKEGQHRVVLVAGGVGVAPLLFLAETLYKRKKSFDVLIGAGNKKHVLCENEFKGFGSTVQVATDDGSKGYKGVVTDLLQEFLSKHAQSGVCLHIYACGPRPMLKRVSDLSSCINVLAQGSLEENMACGVGACLGCVVETSAGYKRVCKEGPVFYLSEIKW